MNARASKSSRAPGVSARETPEHGRSADAPRPQRARREPSRRTFNGPVVADALRTGTVRAPKPAPPFAPLSRSFFDPPADVVAPALLGHLLIRNTPQGPCGGLIVETEAYLADDPACHAFGGETARNRAMFGPPGRAYVYLIYGMHYCVNAVCRPRGIGEAVLIRAIEPTVGLELMQALRPVKRPHDLTNGPAKLCAALGIERELDETDLCEAASSLFIACNLSVDSARKKLGPIARCARIGITKAATLPLRFFLKRSAFVSRG